MNYLGIAVSCYIAVRFYQDLGKIISVRNVFAVLMCLQFIVGPFLVYNGFAEYQVYVMRVTEEAYFSYVTPAIIAFLIGLYVIPGRKKRHLHEYNNIESLKLWNQQNSHIPIVFIVIGFLAGLIVNWMPDELNFIIYILSNLKFIGLFLLLLADKKLHLKWLVLIYGSIILSSFAAGMFHDLFIWSIFFISVICYKYKFKTSMKLSLLLVLSFMAIFIQSIKFDLRQRIWTEGEEISINLVEDSYKSSTSGTGGLFSKENLAPQIIRINQGWIISCVMDQVPKNVPYADGETIIKYLEAAFLPRYLAPNKLTSGDKDIFIKYTGHIIGQGTSMGISSVGDAYINYGKTGGWIFMLIYGFIFNLLIRFFIQLSDSYPTSYMFLLLVLFYTVRPDCELQTTLGHFVKTCMLLLIMYRAFGKYFRVRSEQEQLFA